MLNNYILNINYYVANLLETAQIFINIKPNYVYNNNNLVNYNFTGTTLTDLPYIDPSGGKFLIINPVNNNLFGKIKILTNGQIVFNNNISLGNYTIKLKYYFNQIQTTITYNFIVQPSVVYLENTLKLVYGVTGYSSIPYTNPINGIFTISNNIYNQTINEKGLITFNNLNYGIYNFNITYNVNNIITNILYNVNVVSLIYYNPSELIVKYSEYGQSVAPTVSLSGGLFQITSNNIITNNITINKEGIIYVSNKTPINYYYLNVIYTNLNLVETIKYNIKVTPYFIYDISSINIYYNSNYKSSKPIIKPTNGIFTINLYDLQNNYLPQTNYLIDNSGIFYLNKLDINYYILETIYTVNNVSTSLLFNLNILPLFYYVNINNLIIRQNNYSSSPIINPVGGSFISNNLNLGTINQNGIITFNTDLNLGIYNLTLGYNYNSVINYFNYEFKVIPYINYELNNIIINAGINFSSCKPIIYPSNGLFSINNSLFSIDLSGILYFNSNIQVNIYNILVNYTINNFIGFTTYKITLEPYIYYNKDIFSYGIINYSQQPIINTKGLYNLIFNEQPYIQINSISIDQSSGIIKFNNDLIVGANSFKVSLTKNSLSKNTLYEFIVLPNISYDSTYILNYGDIKIIYPYIINPKGGLFTLISTYDFITLIDNINGAIEIKCYNIGYYNFKILYTYANITKEQSINLIFQSNIYYSTYKFIYSFSSETDSPIVSLSGGLFNLFVNNNINNNIYINNNTGVIYFNSSLEVAYYNLVVTYTIKDISSVYLLNIPVIPYFYYEISPFSIEYGFNSQSNTPYYKPYGGVFNIINKPPTINIDNENGNLLISSLTNVNRYLINISYTYTDISATTELEIIITPKIVESNFIIYDKIYDEMTNLKVKSNNLINVINNDKVFIKSYNASFYSNIVSNNSLVTITNIVLGGPNMNNYNILPNLNTTGVITYFLYLSNNSKINKGSVGNSGYPLVSKFIKYPSFIIQNPQNGFNINDVGLISWDASLEINTFNLSILIFNVDISFSIIYTLTVTTNLYSIPLSVIVPLNYNLEYNVYQLRYTSISGLAYTIDNTIVSGLGKFNIRSYLNENLNHDLDYDNNFIFNLPNANPTTNLIIYELNDDETTNINYTYNMIYQGNNNWLTSFRYLSDFYIQDTKTIINNPPVFLIKSGIYQGYVNVKISALPNSVVYYSLNGLDPTIDSFLYKEQFILKISCKIKAIAYTPGYLPSGISEVEYIIIPLPCILSNTLVKTPTGYEFIDNLKINDIILTYDNREVPIINILKYEINNPKENEYPIIITKNLFGFDLPNKDTYLSETHAILCPNTKNEWILPDKNLDLFKRKIIKIIYYNIELPNYFTDYLVVNNLPIESLASIKTKYTYVNKKQKIINKNKFIIFDKIKKL